MRTLPALSVFALVLVAGIPALGAKDGPKTVVIKACQSKKPPVTLGHEAHVKKAKIACKTCHHPKEKAIKPCSAAGCHAGKAAGKKLGCADLSLTKNVYHVSCIGCHKKEKRGPKACAACHKK